MSNDPAEPQHDAAIHQFVHDVKHCLHVIGMGAEILKNARNDDATFARISAAMDQERTQATHLLDSFLRTACPECDRNQQAVR